MLSLLHKKINEIVPITGIAALEDGSYQVHYVDEPTEEQQSAVDLILDNADFELAKFNKLQQIENEWKQTLANGWETSDGYRLGIDISDVALLTGLFTLAKEASSLGINDPVSIIDTDGISHTLSLTQLTQLMLAYGNARANLSSEYANRINSAKQATTIEELGEV